MDVQKKRLSMMTPDEKELYLKHKRLRDEKFYSKDELKNRDRVSEIESSMSQEQKDHDNACRKVNISMYEEMNAKREGITVTQYRARIERMKKEEEEDDIRALKEMEAENKKFKEELDEQNRKINRRRKREEIRLAKKLLKEERG